MKFLLILKKNKSTLDQCEFILCTGLIEGKEENLDYYKNLLKNHVSKKLICTNPDLIVHRGEVARILRRYNCQTF